MSDGSLGGFASLEEMLEVRKKGSFEEISIEPPSEWHEASFFDLLL